MENSFRKTWFSPVFSSLLANRLQLGLTLLHLPGWICPFKAVFGVPCPGCGLTTAILELIKGKVSESLHTHAFASIFLFAFLLILVAVFLPRAIQERFAATVARFESRTGITAWVLSGLMLYWLIRLFGLA
jgi:hypothetical protein